MIGMPGSMGKTSPAGSLPRATPPCCSQSAMLGARSSEMVHQGTTLSEALKNIRGDFLFWQREVYEHLNRAPEKGKSKSKAPKVWQTQWEKPKKGGKGSWPSGPTPSRRARAARRSPPTPPRLHGRTTGLSRIPQGWRTAEIITFTTSVRDHAADPTTARSGRMGGCPSKHVPQACPHLPK